MPWVPGDQFMANVATAWQKADFGRLFLNSLVVSAGIVVGKIALSLLAAFAVTYFRFPFRMTAFWLIFVSLMLPIEVRIVPTYEAAANAALPWNAIVDALDLAGARPDDHRAGTHADAGLVAREHLFGLDPAADRLGHRDLPVPAVLPHRAGRALRRRPRRRRAPDAVLLADPAAAVAIEHRRDGDHPLLVVLEPVSLAAPRHDGKEHVDGGDRASASHAERRRGAFLARPDERDAAHPGAAGCWSSSSRSAGSSRA